MQETGLRPWPLAGGEFGGHAESVTRPVEVNAMAPRTKAGSQAGLDQKHPTESWLHVATVLVDAVVGVVALFAFVLLWSIAAADAYGSGFSSWVPALTGISVLVACAVVLTVRTRLGRWPSWLVTGATFVGTVLVMMGLFVLVG